MFSPLLHKLVPKVSHALFQTLAILVQVQSTCQVFQSSYQTLLLPHQFVPVAFQSIDLAIVYQSFVASMQFEKQMRRNAIELQAIYDFVEVPNHSNYFGTSAALY